MRSPVRVLRLPGTTSASTIGAAVRVHDDGVQVDLRRASSPSAATSAEKRAATRQNSSTASGRAWRAARRAAAQTASLCDEPPRPSAASKGGTARRRRRSASTCTPPSAEHDDRAELLVVDHAEQHLDAAGRDHRRDQHARTDALRQDRARRRRPRASSREAEPHAVEVALVVDAALRGLQHDRESELARGGAAPRPRSRRCGRRFAGRPASRSSCSASCSSSARPSASRARQRARRGSGSRGSGAARARREIAVVEQAAHAAQEGRAARRAPGIPRASRRR